MLPGSSPTGRVAKMPAGVEKEPSAATLSKKSFLVPVIERLAMALVTDPIALACRSYMANSGIAVPLAGPSTVNE